MTSTVVKAADAAQFLTVVPRMLGYRPARSLVLIPFRRGRSLGAMRFDLPDPGPGAAARVAATMIGMACRVPDADAVAAIAYTDARFADGERMPHRDLLDALARRADACGLGVTDLLCVGADAWGSALDPDCPAAGRPLDDLDDGHPALPGPAAPAGDQASGAELPECTDEEREHVSEALQTLAQAIAALCGADDVGGTASRTAQASRRACVADLGPVPGPISGDAADAASALDAAERVDPRALAAVSRLDDLPAFYEEVLEGRPGTPDAYDTAVLIWCLSRPSLRDVALLQWSGNLAHGDEAFDAQLRWESGEPYPEHLGVRLWGEGEQPDPDRLQRALEHARHAAAAAPRDVAPGPLALCAWLSWALGLSTHAAAYAGLACEIEPAHGLSQIVLSFVHAGHLPDWAFQRAGGR